MVTEYIKSTIKYIENNLQSEAVGAILIVALLIFAVLALVFLGIRRLILWYWRINEQVSVLEKIDIRLQGIEKTLPCMEVTRQETEEMTAKPEKILKDTEKILADLEKISAKIETPSAIHIQQAEQRYCENPKEISITKAPKGEQHAIAFDKNDEEPVDANAEHSGYNIGKTGKIYVEDVLRKQIQF